jgi:hypothetical protein
VLAAGLFYAGYLVWSGQYCAYMGTDFRGYYAAAQIAWREGFAQVYLPGMQELAQAKLAYTCLDGSSVSPLIYVYVPYLPASIVLFLPLPLLGLTTSYYAWSLLNLVGLGLYTIRFVRALGVKPGLLRTLQWAICLPALSNLALGQSNLFLTVCLGEFVLSILDKREGRAGLWLAAMLIKPYILILLFPGLLLARRWRAATGFITGAVAVIASSVGLAGWKGVWNSLNLAGQFAGKLIQTGPAMVNWRALGLNLAEIMPGWAAWILAAMGMAIVCGGTLALWMMRKNQSGTGFLLLVMTTLAATFTVSWHAHFYLLMLLIPVLAALDMLNRVPVGIVAAWTVGPIGVYLSSLAVAPALARNLVGLFFLALNLVLLLWSARLGQRNIQNGHNGLEFT